MLSYRKGSARWPVVALVTVALGTWSAATHGQATFSINYQGPVKGAPDPCAGVEITEGDILTAAAPPAPPCVFISGGFGPPGPGLALPMHPIALGPPAPVLGVSDLVELDALSYGDETILTGMEFPGQVQWYFSVDEYSIGIVGSPAPPAVWSEGAFGAMEAAADVYVDMIPGAGPGPTCATLPIFGNTLVIDGDGVPIPPGLGLPDVNPPIFGPFDAGANLDALDFDTPLLLGAPALFPVFYSLDADPMVFDPLDGVAGSASAVFNGPFVGGDVLMTPAPGAPPVVYAASGLLGLNMVGPDADELDALVLHENGDGIYTPSAFPYDWVTDPAVDMLLFSVSRGSAVVGMLDSLCGMPIAPGDILYPVPGGPPGIWIPAEALGLATVRSGFAVDDELDALDMVRDCDLDGISDAEEIAYGGETDADGDGIPDRCEAVIVASDPPDGAIDARQPSLPDGTAPVDGFGSVTLTFDVPISSTIGPADFSTSELGGDGIPVTVAVVTALTPTDVLLTFSAGIEELAWTTVTYNLSGSAVTLGYLPGDVNGDGTSAATDLLAVIDHLNGITLRPIYSVDVDRSGVAGAPDLLREIDLLNGAGVYTPYLGVSLP